jgi:hypothetical protein
MKIIPKCLQFHDEANKGAAYTSDGFMLPCCWLDDPPVHNYIMKCGLKDESLAVSNNDSLEKIFTSDQWENFFTILIHDPENASYMCKKKCGVDVDKNRLRDEENKANAELGKINGKNN